MSKSNLPDVLVESRPEAKTLNVVKKRHPRSVKYNYDKKIKRKSAN